MNKEEWVYHPPRLEYGARNMIGELVRVRPTWPEASSDVLIVVAQQVEWAHAVSEYVETAPFHWVRMLHRMERAAYFLDPGGVSAAVQAARREILELRRLDLYEWGEGVPNLDPAHESQRWMGRAPELATVEYTLGIPFVIRAAEWKEYAQHLDRVINALDFG